jgi:hypothetical protein
VPPVTEADIQAQLLKEYASDSGSSLSDLPDDVHSSTASNRSSQTSDHSTVSDGSNDADFHPTTSLSNIRVLDIERELSLTCVQADRLHHVMRSAMLNAGLLGNLNFKNDNEKHNHYMFRVGKVAKRRDGSVDDGVDAPVSVSTALKQLHLDATPAPTPRLAQDDAAQDQNHDNTSSPMQISPPSPTPRFYCRMSCVRKDLPYQVIRSNG